MGEQAPGWGAGLAERLAAARLGAGLPRCLVGFDGYVDDVVRVVRAASPGREPEFFATISEFAGHIEAAAGKSADMRIVSSGARIGGNGPLLSCGLASLGASVVCVGAMGLPELHPLFAGLPAGCRPMTIAEPGFTHAFEFLDGKLMFGNAPGLDSIDWRLVKESVGLDSFVRWFAESDLVGVVNWSSMHGLDSILEGIVAEVLPEIPADTLRRKLVAFDIADPSARSGEDFERLVDAMRAIGKRSRVALCLNEKEALIVRRYLALEKGGGALRGGCESIYERLGIDLLQVHAVSSAVGVDRGGSAEIEGIFVPHPVLTTGGGDNFNGGFLASAALGLGLEDSLRVGNAAAAYYVSKGRCASFDELGAYLSEAAGGRERRA
ncbi:MAG TPA: PfkB family carbohydrate kinase [Spirochaetia bacterium]|nr:PfkB family carbohydrate kinase [Spirochaetia bacterium]